MLGWQRPAHRGCRSLVCRSLEGEIPWAAGGASRWWLHHSLESLRTSRDARGSRLLVRTGATREVLRDLAQAAGAVTIFCERIYDPLILTRDAAALRTELRRDGIVLEGLDGALLTTLERVHRGRVFRFESLHRFGASHVSPSNTRSRYPHLTASLHLAAGAIPCRSRRWDSRPGDWAGGLYATWQPGERALPASLGTWIGAPRTRITSCAMDSA
jgi:deoxyribodipyrimidine photo-lyase